MNELRSAEQAHLNRLLERLPGYLPGLSPEPGSAGLALLRVLARYLTMLDASFERFPERSRLAFLNLLGAALLPAQGARAPLVFTLAENSPVDVTLPPLTQAAATVPGQRPVMFLTTQPVTLTRARLQAVYSVNPRQDAIADHLAQLADGFALFGDLKPAEHTILLGHDTFFNLSGDITVMLSFTLRNGSPHPLDVRWDYRGEDGWLPLEKDKNEDSTAGFMRSGQLLLHRACGPDAARQEIAGRNSYWLRGSLASPLLTETGSGLSALPEFSTILARVGYKRDNLQPEAAYAGTVTLDTSKEFRPFGDTPTRYSTFYLACKEAFQRKGARCRLDFHFAEPGVPMGSFRLAWEYYNGQRWQALSVQPDPTGAQAFHFNRDDTIFLTCPRDWQPVAVNGNSNYWLRVRILSGDYGHPLRVVALPPVTISAVSADRLTVTLASNPGYSGGEPVTMRQAGRSETGLVAGVNGNALTLAAALTQDYTNGTLETAGPVKLEAATLAAPVIGRLALGYFFLTDPQPVDHCLALNEAVYSDHSEDCRWHDRSFIPFRPFAEQQPAVYFGFDQPLPAGLVSLYAHSAGTGASASDSSPFLWEYHGRNGWSELAVVDETAGFRQSGMLQFIGPPDAERISGLGGALFRIRARLKPGGHAEELPLEGLWQNAAWGLQSLAFERDPLGQSSGAPDQAVFFPAQRVPVLEGQRIEVREWQGSSAGWKTAFEDLPEADLRKVSDPLSGAVAEVWVRWEEVNHFYASGPGDRHYTLDRASGVLRFSDGIHGRVPPAGAPVAASYRSGGGQAGNLAAGTIIALHAALPFVQAVTNPVAATGGADVETSAAAAARGSQRIRHHGRAVSASDYEWLARDASPGVARAACLPLVGPDGKAQRGWVTLVIVPAGSEPRPHPTPELLARVQQFVARHAPASLTRVRVVPPQYQQISVRCRVAAASRQQAATLETSLRAALDAFLHPLSGGPQGQGWGFGQPVYLSQVARLVESLPGVDYAAEIVLRLDGHTCADSAPIAPFCLPSAGAHEILILPGGD